MRRRLWLIAVVSSVIVSSAAMRGCWDLTEPDPWVADGAARYGALAHEVR
jgi:hypothetical protein